MKSKQIQEFKETEIGKIPADWEINSLGNVQTDVWLIKTDSEGNTVDFP